MSISRANTAYLLRNYKAMLSYQNLIKTLNNPSDEQLLYSQLVEHLKEKITTIDNSNKEEYTIRDSKLINDNDELAIIIYRKFVAERKKKNAEQLVADKLKKISATNRREANRKKIIIGSMLLALAKDNKQVQYHDISYDTIYKDIFNRLSDKDKEFINSLKD